MDTPIDEMFLNLKILAQLKECDKLISQGTLEIDNRALFQGLRRWLDEESRDKTVQKIESVFNDIFNYIDRTINEESNGKSLFDQDSSQLLQRFVVDIKNAIAGIENLKLTYRADITIKSKLGLLIDELKIKMRRLNDILRIDLQHNK